MMWDSVAPELYQRYSTVKVRGLRYDYIECAVGLM